MEFFGRKDILAQLNDLWGKNSSSFVTCRGRRRIGKSTLIEHFAVQSKARFIKIEGIKPTRETDDAVERRMFSMQLAEQSQAEASCPDNWLQAFIRLSREINDKERTVVLIDETSWLAHYEDTFAGTLKIAWDNHLKAHGKLIFVICGSVSTWIRDHIIDNGAFYGRRSLDIVVPELPLSDCVRFWGKKARRMATKDIYDVLSVTGGVPRYLEEINPSLSAVENIRRLCFLPRATLREDFDAMFEDVITRQPRFTGQVLRTLVDGPLSVSEIASTLNVEKGGDISRALVQLCESGMVSANEGRNPETGVKVREVRYRLSDNYVRFYLKYIEPDKGIIDDGTYSFSGFDQFTGWNTVMGFAFENLVIRNYRELLGPLHLDRAILKSVAPYRKNGSRKRDVKGVQIDLLLQTAMSMCLIEIKRRDVIDRSVIDEVKEKVRRFRRPQETTLRLVLVYEGSLDRKVETDGYFDALINARSLLGV